MNPIIWLAALAIIFIFYDEGQRLRRRVKALEERLDRLEGRPEAPRPSGAGRESARDWSSEGRFPS